jgi:hypothetical protein
VNFLKWLFKPTRCKAGLHNYVKETVLREDRTVVFRLQCLDCPHHTNGWEFNPRQNSMRSFR